MVDSLPYGHVRATTGVEYYLNWAPGYFEPNDMVVLRCKYKSKKICFCGCDGRLWTLI